MKIKATASGKVFLTGEYMALEGGKAIILSTPQKARINLIENDFRQNIFTSSMDRKSYNFIVNNPSKINWLKEDPIETGSILEEAIRRLQDCDWDAETLSSEIREVGDALNAKSQVPVRIAVTGRRTGLPLFEPMAYLSRELVLERLQRARSNLG